MLYTIRFAAFHRQLFYPATSQNWTGNLFSPAGFSPFLIGSHAKLPLVFMGKILARLFLEPPYR
nr:MAG TPA: hypothetical protein [Caudoviricetes sp.]